MIGRLHLKAVSRATGRRGRSAAKLSTQAADRGDTSFQTSFSPFFASFQIGFGILPG
jgi:hypothetical protein